MKITGATKKGAIKKGLKKGTYKLTVKVTAEDRIHKAYSDTVKVKIKVS